MKNSITIIATLVCTPAFAVTMQPEEVDLPETQVIAVKTSNGKPSAYAEAFGKLVGYYAQPSAGVKVVFPQRSITINGASYAAVGIGGPLKPPQGIEVLTLPRCHFISMHYTGNYDGIGPAIDGLVSRALSQHRQINPACGIRIHHLNSPDNTPIDQLEHVLHVPAGLSKP